MLVALCVVRLGGDAHAETPAELPRQERIERAKALFESGVAHYNLGEYDEAVADFESGYRYRPEPLFLYNIAQGLRRAHHRESALAYYHRYLELVPDAPERASVLVTIEELSRTPAPSAVAVSTSAVSSAHPPAPATHRARLVAALTIGAGAVALTGVGLGLELSANDSYQTLLRTCAPNCDRGSWASLPARYYAADALFATAAGLAVVDVVLWTIELRARRVERRSAPASTQVASP